MKGRDSISPPTDGSEKYQFCLDFFFLLNSIFHSQT